jgi:hypothetical protein
MDRRKELPLSRNDTGTKAHPHRASAGPDCRFANAPGPAMQRGGGSKLKGLTGGARVPHADAANGHDILHDLSDTPCPLRASPCGKSDGHTRYVIGSLVLLCDLPGLSATAARAGSSFDARTG